LHDGYYLTIRYGGHMRRITIFKNTVIIRTKKEIIYEKSS